MEALLTEAVPLLGGILGVSPRIARPSAAAAGAHGVAVDVVDTIAGLESIAEEWRALERAPGSRTTPFQTYAFHREWVRHFVDEAVSFRIVVVREGKHTVLILPLAIRGTPVGRIARWMGEPLIQYGDVICKPDADPTPWLDAALAALTAQGDIAVLTFKNVRADAAIAGWIDTNMTAVGRGESAIAVDLGGFCEPCDFDRTNTRRAARNRRRTRRLAAHGEIALHILGGCEDAVSRVADAIAMKTAWLRQHGLMGRAFADPRVQACLEALVRRSPHTGVVVASLDVGKTPAAIEIGFRHNGRHCAFLGAFAPDFTRAGPGHLQIQKTIEWNIGQETLVYDLMAPADAYKREFGSLVTPVRDYTAPLSIAGIPAAFWSTYVQRGMKATFNRLPRALRMTIRERLS